MSKPISIIAFDPGETTGYATGTVEDGTLRVTSYGDDPWKLVLLRFVRSMLGHDGPAYDRVVYESWRLQPDKAHKMIGSDMQSSQFIGGVKAVVWWCQTGLQKVVTLHTNEPGNKPSVDGWMAKAGDPDYLPRTDKEHPRDAVRHLYYDAIYRLGVREEDCYGLSQD